MYITLSYLGLAVILTIVFGLGLLLSEFINRRAVENAVRQERLRNELNRDKGEVQIFPVPVEEDALFIDGGTVFRYSADKTWVKER